MIAGGFGFLTLSEEESSIERSKKNSRTPNRLVQEKSPYLLQHAYNPVDWYPWGEEAINRAKQEDRLIFLSIGYSSCHWCHVMERESFEDEALAKLLNENFVCIKVDREERPDLDEIYMRAVMSMTGSGGWPLSVFLTPSLEPFYGGTYFPPVARYGVPGFSTILQGILKAWKTERKQVLESASGLRKAIKASYSFTRNSSLKIDEHPLDDCFSMLAGEYDQQYGGFGRAPKFPSPSNILFLLRYHVKTGEKSPLQMALKTLDCMSRGGIYDHLRGGFHRYSTDREWIVPHFEKMLYDNALLSIAYTEAYQVTKNKNYERVVEETLGWALSEMRLPEQGGFFSAQDADSPEGEGFYYTWTPAEVEEAVPQKGLSDLALGYFSISPKGNYEGRSVLSTENDPHSYSAPDLEKLHKAKQTMLAFRAKERKKPTTDDKILTGWNGLMISALSKAFRVFGKEEYESTARKAAKFILEKLSIEEELGKIRLTRRFREGEARGDAVLEDYAYLSNGLIDLYEATLDADYLKTAVKVCDMMIADFYDKEGSGFFSTAKSSLAKSHLIARAKEASDGAIPSGNSVAILVLLRLWELTSKDPYRSLAEQTLLEFWGAIEANPASHAFMLVSLYFMIGGTKEIVLSGERGSDKFGELLETVNAQFLPNSVLAFASKEIEALCPIVEERISRLGEEPRAYVCQNFSCKLPSRTPEELLLALGKN